jgi:hypothetical protein
MVILEFGLLIDWRSGNTARPATSVNETALSVTRKNKP